MCEVTGWGTGDGGGGHGGESCVPGTMAVTGGFLPDTASAKRCVRYCTGGGRAGGAAVSGRAGEEARTSKGKEKKKKTCDARVMLDWTSKSSIVALNGHEWSCFTFADGTTRWWRREGRGMIRSAREKKGTTRTKKKDALPCPPATTSTSRRPSGCPRCTPTRRRCCTSPGRWPSAATPSAWRPPSPRPHKMRQKIELRCAPFYRTLANSVRGPWCV